MGIFKKNKSDDKEKIQKDAAPEPEKAEKEEGDEKRFDDLMKENQSNVNKNSPFFLFLENDEDRKIVTEIINEHINSINTLNMTEAFFTILEKWE